MLANYNSWVEYFDSNKTNFDFLNLDGADSLTSLEKSIITKSIRQFQEGESGEGNQFKRKAVETLKGQSDKSYLVALDLFIKEEQRHSLVLGQFMDKHGISKSEGDKLDSAFTFLRQLAGLELEIIVLLTAEIIAMVYYDALKKSTNSNVLQSICTQILKDEIKHLEFQARALADLYYKRPKYRFTLLKYFRRFFLFGTAILVWFYHFSVYRKGNYTFNKLLKTVFLHLRQTESYIQSKNI